MTEVNDPSEMLERRRSRVSSGLFRTFAVLCCRRIWEHLPADLRKGVEIAEQYLAGLADDDLRKRTAADMTSRCIYADGDSSADDRYSAFAAEAVLCCLFGDDDFPPITTFATTCAIAASRGTIEVIIAFAEMSGHDETSCRQVVSRERDWQCKLISELFEIDE